MSGTPKAMVCRCKNTTKILTIHFFIRDSSIWRLAAKRIPLANATIRVRRGRQMTHTKCSRAYGHLKLQLPNASFLRHTGASQYDRTVLPLVAWIALEHVFSKDVRTARSSQNNCAIFVSSRPSSVNGISLRFHKSRVFGANNSSTPSFFSANPCS